MRLFDRVFSNISIRWKVVAIILGVAAISLLLAGAGLLWNARLAFEREIEQKLTLLADVIGLNSTAALAFQDARAAGETLTALRGDSHVLAGGLYDANGRLFARYLREPGSALVPEVAPALTEPAFEGDRASVVRVVELKGRSVGMVYLLADTDEWTQTMWNFIGILAVLFAIVLTFGLLVSIWLQPLITHPITELAEVMRRVGRSRDPTFRAAKRGNDEIGALVDGFNDMLAELGKRRTELEQAQAQLRQRVTDLDAEVAERRRAETELRYTSDQLKNFIENANIGLHWVGPDGVILWANRYELDMLGYTAAEYIGHPIAEFHADPAVVTDILAQLSAGGSVDNLEARLRRKDGSILYALISTSVYWENGKFIHTRGFTRDITERKRAEELFRLAVEAAPTGMVMVDQQGHIVLANRQLETLFGYCREELIGQPIERLVPEPIFADTPARPMGAGRESYGHHKNGRQLPIEVGLNPFRTSEGALCLASIIDIAERKRAQDALRQSEERYRTLVAATTSVVFTDDANGRVLGPNPAWEAYTGQPDDAYLERGWLDMLHAEDREPARRGWERALREGSAYEMEVRIWHERSHTHRYCVLRSVPLRNPDGSVREWIGTLTDIDDRKRADERFRLAVEAAPTAMVMIDPQGKIVLANRQLEMLFGYTREELFGRSIEMLVPERARRLHPGFPIDFPLSTDARLMGSAGDLYGRHKDGRHVMVEIGLNPFTTADGAFCLASIVDITERKRAEQELRRFTDELQRSNRELAQFAYVASHDLQEPLRAISGCVQLLQQRYRSKLDERADELIQHAVGGALRMQTLINDLLSYSRIGTRAKPFEPCDLGQSLQETLANLSVAIKEAGASVTWDDMPVMNADPTQFTQLFQNLVSNALKFRGEHPARIHIGVDQQGAGQIVYVRDNGIGIEPQYYERIFGVFQRLHGRNKYPGNGIGLAICRKIVERHGGRMWVESVPGQGSTFYFTIPDGGGHNEQQQPERESQQ